MTTPDWVPASFGRRTNCYSNNSGLPDAEAAALVPLYEKYFDDRLRRLFYKDRARLSAIEASGFEVYSEPTFGMASMIPQLHGLCKGCMDHVYIKIDWALATELGRPNNTFVYGSNIEEVLSHRLVCDWCRTKYAEEIRKYNASDDCYELSPKVSRDIIIEHCAKLDRKRAIEDIEWGNFNLLPLKRRKSTLTPSSLCREVIVIE